MDRRLASAASASPAVRGRSKGSTIAEGGVGSTSIAGVMVSM
jgi:Flp pilus assembly CpaE family ATPase